MQIGAEKPAAEPNAEADENWENAFSGSDSEDEIELPNNIFGEDEIDTSDYDSFIDYVEENGLYYDFYAGYNERGEKVRFAELYDRETGERLATLQEGKDFFYAKDGVFFTKDFTYNSRGRKILEMRAGIYVGDDARELFESLGYEISISGNTIYITDETGKTLTFARGEEFSTTKNGIFIAPGALNSKTIQDLIKNNPKSRGIVSSNSNSSLEIMRSYAGDAANDENTVTHVVVSAMEALDSDKALRQEVETNKQQGLGAQIWDALNNAWDSLVKSVSGVDEAFKNAGESFIKGVSGIDEAVAAGGQALTKSTRDLKKVLSSEDTKNALWFALYSILAAHTGGLTTMISSGDKNLDEAWKKINNVRMISPSSWTKTISYITLPETRVLLNSISNQDHAKLLFEVVNNADTIASMSAEELEPILEDMVKCLTGELIKPFISEW